MRWLIVNTESFSSREITGEKDQIVDKSFLPPILRFFLSVFHYPFIILDESSKIKTNTPMQEHKKSSRCRVIRTLNDVGERAIMTGTLKSKSSLNAWDQYNFLDPNIYYENPFEFAERYCVMITIRVGRGRRVIIGQKDYDSIRKRMVNAYARGGDTALRYSKLSIFKQYTISEEALDHIMAHKKYTPSIHEDELAKRAAFCTVRVKREDVFDTKFERFVDHPIVRKIEPTKEQVKLSKELVDTGFSDNFVLGKVPALELMHRLQDVCNGFEPLSDESTGARITTYKPLKENPKLDAIMALIDEINPDENQIALFSARDNLTEIVKEALTKSGITFAHYYGNKKAEAEKVFASGNASVFLSNLEPSAYGLNSLAKCNYAIYACSSYQAEIFYQSKHRLLRGQLTAPKFAYHLCTRGSVEERMVRSLDAGIDLINDVNSKATFEMRA